MELAFRNALDGDGCLPIHQVSRPSSAQDAGACVKLAIGLLHLLANTLRNVGNLQTAAYTAVMLVIAQGMDLTTLCRIFITKLAKTQSSPEESSEVIAQPFATFIAKGGNCTLGEFWTAATKSLVIVLDIVIQRTGLGLKDMNVDVAGNIMRGCSHMLATCACVSVTCPIGSNAPCNNPL